MKKNVLTATVLETARLDKALVELFSLTRSQGQKLIADNQVTINGELPKKVGGVVRGGDVIVIARSDEGATRQSPNRSAARANEADSKNREIASLSLAMTLIVIAETTDYIVVNKPTGLLVHPTQANETNTLVNFLIKKYPEISKVGDDPKIRPGIVHRLDKEASGLLVVARTQKMFNHLKDQFKNRTIEKEYWALVHGKVAKDWDILTFPIARSETYDRMAARPLLATTATVDPSAPLLRKGRTTITPPYEGGAHGVVAEVNDAKSAKTEFLVERRFVNFTLLRVILHTGRMHQIRVHMLAYNHPLVGDPLYIQKKRKRNWDEKLGRLFLHATKLSFNDLEGQRQTFESPLPVKLDSFLKQLI